MQYICKKDKVNQAERIWESKYKTTIKELEKLKDKYKEMEKEQILPEQIKTKQKNLHQEKEHLKK